MAAPEYFTVLVSTGDAALGVAECVQYGWFLAAGVLGSCALLFDTGIPRGGHVGDTASMCPDLIWATLMGFLVFGDDEFDAAGRAGDRRSATWVAQREAGIRRIPLTVAPRVERA